MIIAKCSECSAERPVVDSAWKDSKPTCNLCGTPVYRKNQDELVTVLGTSDGGVFKPAPSNPWFRRGRARNTNIAKVLEKHVVKRAKPLCESVAKKPEVKLRPIRDHSHNQAWRNSSKGSE